MIRAHELIDALRNNHVFSPDDAAFQGMRADFAEFASDAVKFHGGSIGNVPTASNEAVIRETARRLPYQNMYVEFDGEVGPLIFLLVEHDDGWSAFAFSRSRTADGGGPVWSTPGYEHVFPYDQSRAAQSLAISELVLNEVTPDDVWPYGSFICRFVAALNCSNVITIENPAPEKLNKKRVKAGKQPLYSYKTLHLSIPDMARNGGAGAGTHASPRVHLRRGHIRRLESKSVWVNPCVVGDKRSGVVMKDYAVTFRADA